MSLEQRLKIKLTTITLINHNTVYNERNYLTLYFFKSGQFEKSFKAIDCTASQLRGAGPKAMPEDTNFAFCQENPSWLLLLRLFTNVHFFLFSFSSKWNNLSPHSSSPVIMFIIRLRDQLVRERAREGRWTLSEGMSTRWESARWQSNVYTEIITYHWSSLTCLKVVKELYLDKWPSRLLADIDGNRMIVDLKGRLWQQDLADHLEIDWNEGG